MRSGRGTERERGIDEDNACVVHKREDDVDPTQIARKLEDDEDYSHAEQQRVSVT